MNSPTLPPVTSPKLSEATTFFMLVLAVSKPLIFSSHSLRASRTLVAIALSSATRRMASSRMSLVS